MTGAPPKSEADRMAASYAGGVRDNGKPIHIPISMAFTFEWYPLDDVTYSIRRRFDFPNGTGYVYGFLKEDPEAREWVKQNPRQK